MARPSTTPSTRDRMLDAAESLLRERGLAGAGIKQVVARARTPIGSVYHHFPEGKTQLAAAALSRHADKARALLEGMFAPDTPVAQRVRTLFRTAARGFERSGRLKSCAIGTVTLDLDAGDTVLRDVCAEAFEGWVDTIARHLPWTSKKVRRSFAEMVVTSFEGAFILSRARQSGQPFITAGEWLAAAAQSRAREST
jgi:AcrR family transcriptional regulator